ncbi:hypothetical protein [Paenibacillus sp. S150]|uniref:hypothetical protein n=1 Tax=Paenibacillus sp. S150 TaxID=2749826 RepID=UPI001C5A5902|nr:hypothetical protein [Paenibacillus sp. S150]MBW4082245.1 hypothetical protein [Paenibacillus sp. S150]
MLLNCCGPAVELLLKALECCSTSAAGVLQLRAEAGQLMNAVSVVLPMLLFCGTVPVALLPQNGSF